MNLKGYERSSQTIWLFVRNCSENKLLWKCLNRGNFYNIYNRLGILIMYQKCGGGY